MKVVVDPLDLAYFVFGVHKWMRDNANTYSSMDGELGYVQACVDHAKFLSVELPESFGGVFVYDVAEVFGEIVADYVARGIAFDGSAIVQQLVNGECVP